MSTMGPQTRLREVLSEPRARAALLETFPVVQDALGSLDAFMDHSVSVGLLIAGVPASRMEPLWPLLAEITRPAPRYAGAIAPRPDDSSDAAAGSAAVEAPAGGHVHVPVEIALTGPSGGNPFVDVDLWADFVPDAGDPVRVGGFYDGDGRYLIRFLPPGAGRWTFAVQSTARELDGIAGAVDVAPLTARGPVQVVDRFAFGYANGDPYVPIGTTAYAWTHQDDALEEITLETLAASAFTKIRMCVFPKDYVFTGNDPRWYPFVQQESGDFDLTRFDPQYFRHLERRLQQLAELGIEADLILFHPYDRWGFADLGPAVDERYLRYVVRRLAAFPNVWWSLANEYDFMWAKDSQDWHRFAEIVREEDHAHHLLSIHNGVFMFDNSAPWATHCSIQRTDSYRTTENVTEWRERWGKPVMVDEPGYEGDLEFDWGNLPATELVRRFWEATIRGGYASHGETYWNADEELFWAKGGRLVGESPSRIAFLARLVAESPTGRLEPMLTGFRGSSAGAPGRYEIRYLGMAQPRVLQVEVPAGARASIDIIDTWEMTVDTLPGLHEGEVRVDLPVKPYLAVRVRVDTPV
jgi:hypothetical protein